MFNPQFSLLALTLLAMSCILIACGGGSSSTSTDSDNDDSSIPSNSDNDDTNESLATWMINTSSRSAQIFESSGSSVGVLEDVQLAEAQTIDGVEYTYIETNGIPKYDTVMTQDMIDALNNRPLANSDFDAGTTTATVGDLVTFGEHIGYNSSTENCSDTGGSGYWPPGPGCPTSLERGEYFTAEPAPASNDSNCSTGLGTIGLMVNGSAIFDWGDGMSWGQNIWYNLAPIAEQYDVDICGGHAANGEYHHHFYTSCLADLVSDNGDEHSPIYGFAADGYPVYGPWENNNELAISAWKIRDYSASESEGGCNTPGERSCILNDVYDVSQGVNYNITAGPDIGENVSTLSGNTLAAVDGYYLEDYYYAQATANGAQLDEHNGHDNNDGRGYHYHITLTSDSGKLSPAFPYTIGPTFYGELPDNAVRSCESTTPGGPGDGGPPLFLF
ncbi:Uncharacterised protein [Zhongshania aliphaticivorans]|uniref:YHYH domain-containing protein n=1 Tax=Zhongshania aliphaticivorans TaxID=1470434 RepID=A0A5S9QL93_9GAMM|nr:YHYH protein [Zhongshania aliphaticivorans]CAA0111560.1 Uncharacterised protein [Zhongshania aliphaticivorans]CAA0118694.1 Uncharacterised protein [Zhongshania aliphaticivorans]